MLDESSFAKVARAAQQAAANIRPQPPAVRQSGLVNVNIIGNDNNVAIPPCVAPAPPQASRMGRRWLETALAAAATAMTGLTCAILYADGRMGSLADNIALYVACAIGAAALGLVVAAAMELRGRLKAT